MAEEAVHRWLHAGGRRTAGVRVDDAPADEAPARLVEAAETEVDALFSAGHRVAFHAARHGPYVGGLEGLEEQAGVPVTLRSAGVVTVESGEVVRGQVVTDRLGLSQQLRAAHGD